LLLFELEIVETVISFAALSIASTEYAIFLIAVNSNITTITTSQNWHQLPFYSRVFYLTLFPADKTSASYLCDKLTVFACFLLNTALLGKYESMLIVRMFCRPDFSISRYIRFENPLLPCMKESHIRAKYSSASRAVTSNTGSLDGICFSQPPSEALYLGRSTYIQLSFGNSACASAIAFLSSVNKYTLGWIFGVALTYSAMG